MNVWVLFICTAQWPDRGRGSLTLLRVDLFLFRLILSMVARLWLLVLTPPMMTMSRLVTPGTRTLAAQALGVWRLKAWVQLLSVPSQV